MLHRTCSSVIALAIGLVAAVVGAVGSPQTASAAAHDPIVFVHGWNGSASNWNTMIDRFAADGWDRARLFAWQYDTSQSNVTTAHELAAYVDQVREQTGAAQVDVVTHSMGGLSSRHYLKNLDSSGKVDDWVSLGGPNHGTTSAEACIQTSCEEMRVGSDFLTALNSGDETPGTFHYGTFWSSCDETINPDDSVVLSGAQNTHVGCVGHLALLSDGPTYAGVRDFVA